MNWSPQQEQALAAVSSWLKKGDSSPQIYRLFGFAGTGKTELAKHFAAGVIGEVLFGAYTGKAAQVMRERGCWNVSTIHRMIYMPREKSRQHLRQLESALIAEKNPAKKMKLQKEILEERENIAQPAFTKRFDSPLKSAALAIIDEASMIDARIGEDLLSFGKKILVIADPGQLPPVKGVGFFTAQEPDIMLTEIHRQARDNPIIALATKVRNKENLELGSYGESLVVKRQDIDSEQTVTADQVLCGTNKFRLSGNARYRTLQGFTDKHPMPGEKIVCLRNNYDDGLLNGTLWTVESVAFSDESRIGFSILPHSGEEDYAKDVEAHIHHFEGRGDELIWPSKRDCNEFDYGYLLTVHKAQGSQWPNVLLFDHSWAFKRHGDKHRWLYTGITRASERITVAV
jgi:ATP-dependent exoDNAse (exonuclease V) alpha subunit